jgi:hypothetical protein
MEGVEPINGGEIVALNNGDVHGPHEAGSRHAEIIPHHYDALQPAAVTLTQGLDEFRVLLCSLRMKPLLELVEDDKHFFTRR